MAYTYLSSFIFLLLTGYATLGHGEASRSRSRGESECRLDHVRAVEPSRRVESEAGLTEYWDESQQQLRCAGVAATRHTIQPRGLLLPEYSNAPRLIYVIQGRGISGVVLPGCPESFQSFQQSDEHGRQRHEQRSESDDQHQKIRRIRQGDIVALPAGVAHWFYNDGQTPVVAVTVLETANSANQLDRNPRKFFLAGNQEREGWHRESESRHGEGRTSNNILSGFDVELLAEAAGTGRETVEKLRGICFCARHGFDTSNLRAEEQRVRSLLPRRLGPLPRPLQSVSLRWRHERDVGFANTRIDWKETPEAHVFKADLPGIKKEEVKVEVEEGRVLQISGERSKEVEEKNDKWHRVERSSGKFLRRFRLPENAKVDQVKASMENGVLTVTVPKEEVKKPEVKAIEISG